jgi:hypothetical protein
LNTKITHALWGQKAGFIGGKVSLKVYTHFVGSGSDIEIKVEDKKGKKVEKLKGKVYGDYYATSIVIPEKAKEELTFTAKLPKHGLEEKSDILRVIKVWNLKWGQEEARREDIVKLSADIEGVPDDSKVRIFIYEYDQDGAHDFIAKFPVIVKDKKIETEWEYEYHEDTDEIPTEEEMKEYGNAYNPPEYFFMVDVNGGRFGKEQESGLLVFKDWVEIVVDHFGESDEDIKYTILLPDGSKRQGMLDNSGVIREKDIPPGKFEIEFE